MEELTRRINEIHRSSKEGLHTQNEEEYNKKGETMHLKQDEQVKEKHIKHCNTTKD
jgi:hypothetical protein